ncbi:hypothetical protein Lalb_Chr16g0389681 [Lupinus albus]|uniref:Uncharacterized protein n=1 Tax=Lupinus albus TaxID=3870 RepID=A0A6A4PDM6_LUPAL|nr:hypothetical protein Lalb_Chr16g0389681 [Lupinus albus]
MKWNGMERMFMAIMREFLALLTFSHATVFIPFYSIKIMKHNSIPLFLSDST